MNKHKEKLFGSVQQPARSDGAGKVRLKSENDR
jgi:hypothetical protein